MEKQSNPKKSSWIKGKCLGKGAFGTVSLAINESDGAVFAVKSVDLVTCLPNQLECLEKEIRILRSLSSPYVVEYLGDDVTRYGSTAMSCRNLHMEYMQGGTVVDVDVIKQRLGDLDERILRWHTRSLLLALKYVHGQGIVHCDVKGKNVLVGTDFTSVKLADFGSAIVKENAGGRCRSGTITPRGSPLWMAPEVIRGEYQGPESDVWSLGCTVIEMVTGKPAWEEDQGFNSLTRIANSEELPQLPAQLSELGMDFVDKCLRRDWKQRWSCDQLLQHPFVASASAPSKIGEPSPRCVLDFGISEFEKDESTRNLESSARDRICKLAREAGVVWESDGWLAVRNYPRESGLNAKDVTSRGYPELMRTTEETEGRSWVGIIRLGTEGTFSETADCCDGTNSVDWRCSHYKVTTMLKCCGWSCRNGSRNAETVESRIYIFCNLLLQLISCNLRIFRYILLVFSVTPFLISLLYTFPRPTFQFLSSYSFLVFITIYSKYPLLPVVDCVGTMLSLEASHRHFICVCLVVQFWKLPSVVCSMRGREGVVVK